MPNRSSHDQRSGILRWIKFCSDIKRPLVRVCDTEHRPDVRRKRDLDLYVHESGTFAVLIFSVEANPCGVCSVDSSVFKDENSHAGALLALEADSKHTVSHSSSFLFQSI